MNPGRRDILRLALQSAVAAAAANLAISLAGTGEALLAVISAVLVLQTNSDQTIESAGSRMVGTLIGTAVGAAALAVTTDTAISVSLAVVMLIMGALVAWKPAWRYGIVAAAGLAVASDAPFLETATSRGIAIFLGAGVGILTGFLVWPESAAARARRQLGEALSLCRRLLQATLSAAVDGDDTGDDQLHSRFASALTAARDTAGSIKLGGSDRERCYGEAVHGIERLWHALIILDRVAEAKDNDRLPFREETLSQIKKIRAATCDALGCAERLERVPEHDLDTLDALCREIWSDARIDPTAEDELENVGLVFGLREVARNMREIDAAIGAMRKDG